MQKAGATIDLTPTPPSRPKYPAFMGALISLLITVALAEIFLFWYLEQQHIQREERIQEREESIFTRRLEAELMLHSTRQKTSQTAPEEATEEETSALDETLVNSDLLPRLFARPSLAEQLFFDYLDRYATIDLSKPKPCDESLKALYTAAETHLDALMVAALDQGGTNAYTLFVERRRAEISMRPYPEETECTPATPAQEDQESSTETPNTP
jgi:hypothetical protein